MNENATMIGSKSHTNKAVMISAGTVLLRRDHLAAECDSLAENTKSVVCISGAVSMCDTDISSRCQLATLLS